MAAFSEDNFVKKLADLNNSQQSIQTLSLWLIHHRKHSKTIVEIWIKELKKARGSKKLTLLYLANDVVQNSKKKGPEFNRDFRPVLVDAFKDAFKDADDKTRGSLDRLLAVWLERGVYEAELLDKIRRHMNKKVQSSPEAQHSHKHSHKKEAVADAKSSEQVSKKSDAPPKKKKKVELSLQEEIELEMPDGPSEAPSAEELVKALSDLENSASSDAAVRERIAALPPEVSDVSLLEKLTGDFVITGIFYCNIALFFYMVTVLPGVVTCQWNDQTLNCDRQLRGFDCQPFLVSRLHLPVPICSKTLYWLNGSIANLDRLVELHLCRLL